MLPLACWYCLLAATPCLQLPLLLLPFASCYTLPPISCTLLPILLLISCYLFANYFLLLICYLFSALPVFCCYCLLAATSCMMPLLTFCYQLLASIASLQVLLAAADACKYLLQVLQLACCYCLPTTTGWNCYNLLASFACLLPPLVYYYRLLAITSWLLLSLTCCYRWLASTSCMLLQQVAAYLSCFVQNITSDTACLLLPIARGYRLLAATTCLLLPLACCYHLLAATCTYCMWNDLFAATIS